MLQREVIEIVACHEPIKNPQLNEQEKQRAFPYEIYLLQACGVPLNYIFTSAIEMGSGWVPHSFGLSNELPKYLAEKDLAQQFIKDHQISLTEDAQKSVDRAKKLMEQPEWAKDLSYVLWLKLLTSLHLISDFNRTWDRDKVIGEICSVNLTFKTLRPYMDQTWDHLNTQLKDSEAV